MKQKIGLSLAFSVIAAISSAQASDQTNVKSQPGIFDIFLFVLLMGCFFARMISYNMLYKRSKDIKWYCRTSGYAPLGMFIPILLNKFEGKKRVIAKWSNIFYYSFYGLGIATAIFFYLTDKKS